MKPILRPYQSDKDYWCVREFLREVSFHNNRHDMLRGMLLGIKERAEK
jgi:hypothetical protein